MKNVYLFLLIAFSTNVLGQELSYTGVVTVTGLTDQVNVSYVLGEGDNAYPINGNFSYNNTNIPVLENYYVGIISYDRLGQGCIGVNTYTATELLEQSIVTVGGCGSFLTLSNFKPYNLKILTTNREVCAGEQLNLIASPAGYPDAAYHWQYSLDNQVTWFNVPLHINEKKINKTALSNFSIQEILGDSHLTYVNKTIYFRLGYNESFISAEPLAIKYSPCAPILVDRTYIAPNCNGGSIKEITAYFERPLEPSETLSLMQIIPNPKVNGDSPFFSQQEEITSFFFDASKGLWAYKFVSLDSSKLINTKSYIIEYQAKKNGIPRGTLQSSEPFIYIDATAVQFEIVNAENPACHDGTVEIVISVTGGTGGYKFYDDTIEIIPVAIKGTDGFYHLKNLAPKVYKIKVTDSNDCIDNGKYD